MILAHGPGVAGPKSNLRRHARPGNFRVRLSGNMPTRAGAAV